MGLRPDMIATLAAGGNVQGRKRRIRSGATANREQVMQPAARLFRERGVDVPPDEIATAADLGSATLHRHFRGRADLVHAVLDAPATTSGAAPPGGTASATSAVT
jgi:Bacterial regulatory proteins, tetR family